MIIDTHVHYNLEPLTEQWRLHWQKAQTEGVTASIIVGANVESSRFGIACTAEFDTLFASVGIHPIEVTEYAEKSQGATDQQLEQFVQHELSELENIDRTEKVVAVGEIGLDYYHLPNDESMRKSIISTQKLLFEQSIQFAQKAQLPIIIHVRDTEVVEDQKDGNAYWDALALLQKYDVNTFTLHCVSGPKNYVQQAVELGGYMGFDGNISYPNAQAIRELFAIVPAERRLLETDAPYLPPQGFRGKMCEPWMIRVTAEYCEQELHTDRQSFVENAKKLFNL